MADAGTVVVDAPRMFVVTSAPTVVEAPWENGADELRSDAVATGDDVSWNEQRARTMPKAAMSAIEKIRLPTTISQSGL
jgi:hypothetical protein